MTFYNGSNTHVQTIQPFSKQTGGHYICLTHQDNRLRIQYENSQLRCNCTCTTSHQIHRDSTQTIHLKQLSPQMLYEELIGCLQDENINIGEIFSIHSHESLKIKLKQQTICINAKVYKVTSLCPKLATEGQLIDQPQSKPSTRSRQLIKEHQNNSLIDFQQKAQHSEEQSKKEANQRRYRQKQNWRVSPIKHSVQKSTLQQQLINKKCQEIYLKTQGKPKGKSPDSRHILEFSIEKKIETQHQQETQKREIKDCSLIQKQCQCPTKGNIYLKAQRQQSQLCPKILRLLTKEDLYINVLK